MKKLLLLLALLLAAASPSFAYEPFGFEVDGLFYHTNSDGASVTVSAGDNGISGNLHIPPSVTYKGTTYAVTRITDFGGCTGLTSVTIPNSVTSIGYNAFYRCSNLTSVTIPNSVTSIGSSAFGECTSLTSVTIPNSVTEMDGWVFSCCKNLTSVNISNRVTKIGQQTFFRCHSLTSINIPNSVKEIGKWAFRECYALTSVTIGNSVDTIGEKAFFDCNSLATVYWNAKNCEKYCNDDAGYYGRIWDYTSLTRVVIGDNVETLPDNFMDGNYNLTELSIGSSVTKVGKSALKGCRNLKYILLKPWTPPTVDDSFPDLWHSSQQDYGYGIDADSCILHVPLNSRLDYRRAEGWKEFYNITVNGTRLKKIKKRNRYDFTPASAALAVGIDGTVSYRNCVVRNVLYTIRGNAYNAAAQCLTIGRVMTADSVAVLNTFIIPEIKGYQQRFNGITMRLAAGTGSLTIDSESAGSHALAVKIGNDEQQTFTLGSRKTSVINYSIASDSYAYIYAVPAASANSNIAPKRTLATANDSLKIYSIEVVPGNVIATGSVPQPAAAAPASDITETSFVANWDDTEAASFDLYVFKNGPTALQEAFDGNSVTTAALTAAGWEMTKGFVEEDALRLGTSSVAGDVTTPALGINGSAVMSFDIKAYANDKDLGKTLDISVVGTGSVNTNTVTTTADYSRYTLLLNGLAANSRVKIAAHEAANNRFLIDNIIVAKSGLGSMGTATAYSENFNSATIATLESAGWQLTKGACDESALRLGTSSVGGEAVTPALGINGNATLSFKTKAYANSKDLGKMLDISVIGSGDIDGNFVTTSAEYVTYTFELSGLDTSSRVKIASHDDANNRFYLDNVKVVYSNVGEAPLEGYPVNTAEYSHEVTGLEPGSSYSYYVIAKNEIGDEADMSNIQIVSTLPGAAAAAAGDINGDTSVDGNDVSILLEMVLAGGVSAEQMPVADINGDNSVDGNDVSILLEMVLSGN